MRIAVVQTHPTFGAVTANVREAISLMKLSEADVYVLPELFATGYNFAQLQEVADVAEPASGQTGEQIAKFARERQCFIAYGFAEKANGKLYNSSALVGPDGLIGVYRKVHLYYRETLFFTPGDLGFPVFDIGIGKVGMMVCFDWFYPESARTLALAGAQLILHPSNLVLPHCPDAMVTRCLENRVFAATANRIGRENRAGVDLTYIGTSEIVSPRGEILTRTGKTETGVAVAEVDLTIASSKRINEYNDLFAGRRPDQYRIP